MIITVHRTKNGRRTKHEIDPDQVDQLDEISGDNQLVLLPGGRQ